MSPLKVCFIAVACAWALGMGTAFAQACYGSVAGIGGNYDPSTGSGFLALRAGPTPEATQLGELLNGDVVQIVGKNDNIAKLR